MKKTKEPKAPKDFSKVVGVLELFVVVSISYMTYVVVLGTDGYIPKALTLPAAVWVATQLVKRFTK
jgi:hypothetical protein